MKIASVLLPPRKPAGIRVLCASTRARHLHAVMQEVVGTDSSAGKTNVNPFLEVLAIPVFIAAVEGGIDYAICTRL